MEAREVRCPRCFAPADATRAISTCRYCGTTLAVQGAPTTAAAPQSPPGSLLLESRGSNTIAVIKVVREHTGLGLGLKEAKELVERAPVVVAEGGQSPRMAAFLDACGESRREGAHSLSATRAGGCKHLVGPASERPAFRTSRATS